MRAEVLLQVSFKAEWRLKVSDKSWTLFREIYNL